MSGPLVRVVHLPGLDGTDQLCAPFLAEAPPHVTARCQALPNDRPRGYDDLAEWVIEHLPEERVALVAESFSGPLALMVANLCRRVAAIVLCASFVDSPLPWMLGPLISFAAARRPPRVVVQALLTGGDRALAEAVLRALASVPRDVIAHRIASLASLGEHHEHARYLGPLLYLRATRDRLVGSEQLDRIRGWRRDAELETVDAPHLMLASNPVAAWRRIEPFLQRVLTDAATGPSP